MLAHKEAGHVRLVSRNGRDHSKRFRDLVAALEGLKPATFTLDGEVAVFDEKLVSRFEWLRHLNHGDDLATPPLFMAFDLLRLESKDYRPEPLKVRRRALEKLVRNQKLILPARRLSPNGFAAWAEVLHRGTRAWWRKTLSRLTSAGEPLSGLRSKCGTTG
jgi:ATP-dependent DNA ligase